MNRTGRVDTRGAAAFVAKALGLATLARDLAAASGPLTSDEFLLFETALDGVHVEARTPGSRESLYAIVADVLFLAKHETPTTRGERASVLVGSAPSDAMKKIFADAVARTEERARARGYVVRASRRTPEKPSRRGMRRRLRALVNALVVSGVVTRAPKAAVYLVFVVGGPSGVALVFGDPRESDSAVTYTARATKLIADMIRDRTQ